jgi:hypothetical protein
VAVERYLGLPGEIGQYHWYQAFGFCGKYAPLCRPLFGRAEPLLQAFSEFIQEYASRTTAIQQAAQNAWWLVTGFARNFNDNFW